MLDAIRLEGAAFCLEIGNFAVAEEMLGKLGYAASASSPATALRQRICDAQITFWKARYGFASAVTARFPNYLSGRLYRDLSRSRKQSWVSRRVSLQGRPNN
jgi:hypothetical protein